MIGFYFLCSTCNTIYGNVSKVYLTNDLGFPKDDLAMLQVVTIPTNMIFAVVSGYLSRERPFYIMSWVIFIQMVLCTYAILVLFLTFPPKEEITIFTKIHVVVVTASVDLTSNFMFVTYYANINKNADQRVAGVHYTILASMNNLCSFCHKTYIY